MKLYGDNAASTAALAVSHLVVQNLGILLHCDHVPHSLRAGVYARGETTTGRQPHPGEYGPGTLVALTIWDGTVSWERNGSLAAHQAKDNDDDFLQTLGP